MKKYVWFMGIDISKGKLDIAVLKGAEKCVQSTIENNVPAIKDFVKEMQKSLPKFSMTSCLVCMEHTGIYNNHLLRVSEQQQWDLCLESAMQIKQSGGLQRGKNDQVDALRIAQYAYKNRDCLKLWQPPRKVITQLKKLSGVRERLINAKKQLGRSLKEDASFQTRDVTKALTACCESSLMALKKDIEKTDKAIADVIKSDPELKRLFDIMQSIPCIGQVTAVTMLVATNEFKDITDPRKFACYVGVAPFEHTSGSSVRGRTRVSKKANLKVKSLFHLVAVTAIGHNPEIKLYYAKRVDAGKHPMNVINAIRNKMIHRIFACVRDRRMFENNYSPKFG